MRTSRVKAKWARGEAALAVTLHLTDPSLHEMVSLMGFDAIWMDMEHHTYSLERADTLMRASRVGCSDIMARPAKGEYMRMARMLEGGAAGILYPRCDDAAEAREVVRWAKFAPLGERGCDGGNADMPYCTMPLDEYTRMANEETFLAIQLEHQAAVDNAEAIADVEGVDVLFLGPGDFSVLEGFPGQVQHPKVKRAMETIAKAAEKTGKRWGTVGFNADHIRTLLDMGASLVAHKADLLLVRDGFQAVQETLAPLGFTFENKLFRSEATSYAEVKK